jgi:hypothetical protein
MGKHSNQSLTGGRVLRPFPSELKKGPFEKVNGVHRR